MPVLYHQLKFGFLFPSGHDSVPPHTIPAWLIEVWMQLSTQTCNAVAKNRDSTDIRVQYPIGRSGIYAGTMIRHSRKISIQIFIGHTGMVCSSPDSWLNKTKTSEIQFEIQLLHKEHKVVPQMKKISSVQLRTQAGYAVALNLAHSVQKLNIICILDYGFLKRSNPDPSLTSKTLYSSASRNTYPRAFLNISAYAQPWSI